MGFLWAVYKFYLFPDCGWGLSVRDAFIYGSGGCCRRGVCRVNMGSRVSKYATEIEVGDTAAIYWCLYVSVKAILSDVHRREDTFGGMV